MEDTSVANEVQAEETPVVQAEEQPEEMQEDTEVKEADEAKEGRELGYVRKWNTGKGYGFLTVEATGDDIFAHAKDVKSEGDGNLDVGTEVEFVIQTAGGKTKAVEITAPKGRTLNVPRLGRSAGAIMRKGGSVNGVVKKWFDTFKDTGGFGFLTPTEGEHEGKDVYVHHAAFGGGSLNIGWKV